MTAGYLFTVTFTPILPSPFLLGESLNTLEEEQSRRVFSKGPTVSLFPLLLRVRRGG
jgi:hypothetical protein